MDPRLLQTISSEVACVCDPRGTVRWAGPAWERVLGRPLAVGEALGEHLVEEDRHTLEAVLERLARQGGVARADLALRTDPPLPPLRFTATAGAGSDTIHLVVLTCPEVARLRAELREARHLFGALVERAEDAIFIKDLEGRYVFANPAATRMVDRATEGLVGATDVEVFSHDTAAEIREVDARVIRTGEPYTYRPVRTDFGEARVYLSTKYPYRDADGRTAGIIGVTRDVTPILRAERAAEAADASFRDLVEGTPDVVLVHAEGLVAYANAAAARALGCATPEELLGLPLLSLVAPEDVAAVASRLPADVEARAPMSFGLRRRDGTALPVEAVDVRVAWMGLDASVLLARDLTERRAMEARMAQADRLATAGTLAAGVAHEVNNPLTFVLHHLRRLEEEVPTLAPAHPDAQVLARLAREAAEGAERIAEIVRGLRALARGEDDTTGPVDVRAAVEQASRMAQVKLRGRARLEVALGDLPPVQGNAGRLVQVVLNLLVNAAQAIPPGSPADHVVRVDAREDGGDVLLTVTDDGPGIPAEVRGRLFEPFVTTRGPGEGTGLGLWLCRSMVSAWRGRIEADDAPGGGARFSVWLPLATTAAAAVSPPPPAAVTTPAPGGRVLVVEDEPLIAELLATALEEDAEVVVAETGAAVRAALGDPRFDVILCDLMLPDTTGMELYGDFIAHGLADRVIFVTGGASSAECRQFLEVVSNPRIDKPFSLMDVRARVRARLAAR